MLDKILGLIIIGIAAFVFWVGYGEPDSPKKIVNKVKPNVLTSIVEKIKVRMDPDTQTPLYKVLKSALENDDNLNSCWGNFKKVQMTSQLHDQEVEIGLEHCLSKILRPDINLQKGCEMEVEVFDTSPPENKKADENTRAWRTNRSSEQYLNRDVVLQISIFNGDGNQRNKTAETGLNIPYTTFAESKFEQKKTR